MMKFITFALASMLVIVGAAAFATPASANDCNKTVGYHAVIVGASVSYGSGCVDVDAKRCTLESDPEYPGLDWKCHKII